MAGVLEAAEARVVKARVRARRRGRRGRGGEAAIALSRRLVGGERGLPRPDSGGKDAPDR
jgi:hypothetical protein